MIRPFTQREWLGLIAGVCWRLVLGRFFAADDMTGPWLVILFGPPVVLLISPVRPLLSWQLPIVTATVAGTFMNRTTGDFAGWPLAEAALWWFLCSLLSLPWALMFHYRSQRFQQLGKTPGIPIAYVGMVVLVFLCCGLTFFGFVAPMYWTDADDARNRMMPFYGLLAATAGIALSLSTERVARKLEIQKLVRGVFELLMIPGVVVGAAVVIGEIVQLFWLKSSEPPTPPGILLCGILVGMEALATMLWLTRLDRRERGPSVQAQ
jgi:peptidoglycan biosynthesis protein MviN/MurJ (putative lipid II flippase)